MAKQKRVRHYQAPVEKRSSSGHRGASQAAIANVSKRPAGAGDLTFEQLSAAKWFASPWAALLLLRGFLGFTFVFAALQKLANPHFFERSSPGSIQAQLAASARTSPIHEVASAAQHAAVLVGVLVALGELAVGIGILLGLWTRVAAAGGILLSLSFFLLVSFNTWPYYYGSDIVFVFAWTPFVLAGGGPWSVDALASRSADRAIRQSSPGTTGDHRTGPTRRLFIERAGWTAAAGLVGAMAALLTAGIGRATAGTRQATGQSSGSGNSGSGNSGSGNSGSGNSGSGNSGSGNSGSGNSGSGSSSTGSSGAPAGTSIGPASRVPVGGAEPFNDPASGEPAFVVQLQQGHFQAFSAICTHAACTVGFDRSAKEFVCPCHGSVFAATNGAVLNGPAVSPLPRIKVTLGSDGNLYVT